MTIIRERNNKNIQWSVLLILLFISGNLMAQSNSLVLTDLSGNIWFDAEQDGIYNSDPTVDGVTVELVNGETFTTVASTVTMNGEYAFGQVEPGKYFLRIPSDQFDFGSPLSGTSSCPGWNDADDQVDNDDNGSDSTPDDVRSTLFTLNNDDPGSTETITYIDFCFYFGCEEENALATSACEYIGDSDIICDVSVLSTFCNIMPEGIAGGDQPSPLCTGGNSEAENISWFAFVAYDGNYNIVLTPTGCVDGNLGQSGIQVGLYEDCTFSSSVFCDEDCNTSPVNIPGDVMNPGQTYYFFIDGCEGSICSYEIDVFGSPIIPDLEPEKICIHNNGEILCDSTEFCLDKNVIFEAQGLELTANFEWSVNVLEGGPYTGNIAPTSTNKNLAIPFSNEGLYEVCLTRVNNACFEWNGSRCQRVRISEGIPVVMDESFSDQNVCIGDLASFDINNLADEDPNNDGISGWQGTNLVFDLGLNVETIPTPGCSYDQQIQLGEYSPTAPENVELSVCESDLPIIIAGVTITDQDFMGNLNYVVDSILLDVPNINGCDSFIHLGLEKLTVFNGLITSGLCTADGIALDFTYDPSLSTSNTYYSYEWTGPTGEALIDSNNDPTDIHLPIDGISGTYTLTITISKNGSSCSYNYSIDMDFESLLPVTPALSGVTEVCEGETTIYTANYGTGSNFIWEYPDDVSVVISGILGSILTVDWTGSLGGDITVMTENSCGFSQLTSLNIGVNNAAESDFDISSNSVCTNNVLTVEYLGAAGEVSEFIWNFGGAEIINGNGSGPGPHQLIWSSPGQENISLVVISNDGCQSEEVFASVTVEEELILSPLFCSPTLNEIVFSWTPTVGVLTYDVELLGGESGGFTGDTEYTVTGLNPGEEVLFRLIATPESTLCAENYIEELSCTAMDCPLITIELSSPSDHICLTDNTVPINLIATVSSIESGTGTFAGPGVIDEAGTFDPKSADLGVNTIIYTFITESGCVENQTLDIDVSETPVADFTIAQDSLCITDNVILQYSGTADADTYDWNFDGGAGFLVPNPTVSFSFPGDKNITLSVTKDNCESELVTHQIHISALLEPLSISCAGGNGFIEFDWNDVDGATIFEVSINNAPPFMTTSTLLVVDNLGSGEIVDISVVAISDGKCPSVSGSQTCESILTNTTEPDQDKVSLFPNPVNDILYVKGVVSEWNYTIYNTLGMAVEEGKYNEGIQLHNLSPGLYILRGENRDGKQIFARSFVKN